MRRCVRHTGRSQRGASFLVALMLFLVCAMVAAVALSASAVNVERSAQKQEDQAYLAVVSALDSAEALVMADDSIARVKLDLRAEGAKLTSNKSGSDTLGLASWAENQAKLISGGSASVPKRVKLEASGAAGGNVGPALVIFEMDRNYNIWATACEYVWGDDPAPGNLSDIREDLVDKGHYAKTMRRCVANVATSDSTAPYSLWWVR